MPGLRRLWVVCTALLFACSCQRGSERSPPKKPAGATIRVAAAADLTNAFEAAGKTFQESNADTLSFTFGASGLLAKQLREGAPFDVFAAANERFVDEAVAAGTCDATSKRLYAQGHLVLWSMKSAVTRPPTTLNDLVDLRFARIAIANPTHAPYGQAAKEALEKSNLWSALQPRLVYGENIRQTMQLVQSGNADVALLAESLVHGNNLGITVAIDPALHAPITQALVVCSKGPNRGGGKAFADFLNAPAGQAVLKRFGFGIPTEVTAPKAP
ncbi:MAG: molybdate ABC transporter substrate-binding protein [Myxococcaceae bacterium]|nr:molybdate ABC transporter substrate-binding protein [Myxococcaceae bacterium]